LQQITQLNGAVVYNILHIAAVPRSKTPALNIRRYCINTQCKRIVSQLPKYRAIIAKIIFSTNGIFLPGLIRQRLASRSNSKKLIWKLAA